MADAQCKELNEGIVELKRLAQKEVAKIPFAEAGARVITAVVAKASA